MATRTGSMPIATMMAGGSTRIGLTWTTSGTTTVPSSGLSCNSPHFSLASAGEFCFMSCPCHPPSILPASESGSDKAIYFLLSRALVSHETSKKNFSESRDMIAFFTNGCFSCFCRKLATNILSIVWRKYLSMVSPSVYRDVLGKDTMYSCQSL